MGKRTVTKKPADKDDNTTIRANVTPEEHEAVRNAAKVICGGITIDQYVRAAVDAKIKQDTGKSLSERAEELTKKCHFVQEELF